MQPVASELSRRGSRARRALLRRAARRRRSRRPAPTAAADRARTRARRAGRSPDARIPACIACHGADALHDLSAPCRPERAPTWPTGCGSGRTGSRPAPTTDADHGADRARAERAADRGRLGLFRRAAARLRQPADDARAAHAARSLAALAAARRLRRATCSRCWRRTARRRGRSRSWPGCCSARRARARHRRSRRPGSRSAARRGSRATLAQRAQPSSALGIVIPGRHR